MKKLVVELTENLKLLHAYAHHKKVGRPSVDPLQISDGTLTNDPLTMAETLASCFGSMYCRVPPR